MTNRITTGIIPDSHCPKCGAALVVLDKRDPSPTAEHRQFVACTQFLITGCNYKTTITQDVVVKMAEIQKEIDAMTVEF